MAKEMNEIISDLISATEQEIYDDAFDKEEGTVLDETGDRSLETMGEGLEGQHEPEEPNEDEETQSEEGQEGEGQDPAVSTKDKDAQSQQEQRQEQRTDPRIPPGRLREANERARASEAERDQLRQKLDQSQSQHRQEIGALNQRLDQLTALLSRQNQTTQNPPQPEQVPDLLEDPKAYAEFLLKKIDGRFENQEKRTRDKQFEASLASARQKHGADFDSAWNAINSLNPQDPTAQATVRSIYGSQDPGEALVAWNKRNQLLSEIGSDPTAFRKKIADEAVAAALADPEVQRQLIESLRGNARVGNNGQPRTTVRIPPSLNGAPGNNANRVDPDSLDNSDSSVFNSAWR